MIKIDETWVIDTDALNNFIYTGDNVDLTTIEITEDINSTTQETFGLQKKETITRDTQASTFRYNLFNQLFLLLSDMVEGDDDEYEKTNLATKIAFNTLVEKNIIKQI